MRDYARQQTAILLRRLAFQLSRAIKQGDPAAIHDLRVSIRRLSRCLRVFAQFFPDRSWKKIRRELAGLTDLASGVRDRDITLEFLAGVPRPRAAAARIESERRKLRRDLTLELRLWRSRGFSRKWRRKLEL